MSSKRSILSGITGKNGNHLVTLFGIATVVGVGAWFLLNREHESKSNFGSTMNSLYPIQGGQPFDTTIHPTLPASAVKGGPGRSFPDASLMTNSLPTPFVELNFPRDYFGMGAMLSNIIDKGAYVVTYTGRPDLLHPNI